MGLAVVLRRSPKKTTTRARSKWEPSPNFFPEPGPRPATRIARGSRSNGKANFRTDRGASLIEMLDRAERGIPQGHVHRRRESGRKPPRDDTGREITAQPRSSGVPGTIFNGDGGLAHVVLPAASSMEKHGTFTNTEGHVQAVRPAIEPVGESRPDWEVFSALSILLDCADGVCGEQRDPEGNSQFIPGYGSLGPAPLPPKVDPPPWTAISRPDISATSRRVSTYPAKVQAGWNRAAGLDTESVPFREIIHTVEGVVTTRRGAAGSVSIPLDAARFALSDGDRVRLSTRPGK